ncbi:cytochrome P450 [Paracoccus sp. PAR01]|uniref:cytochrome P450 n=1 Tax=Paracoccus sp. PAR01 TaxID=2769282 RepID=UPI001782B1E4|nr:cytochrome P450 [Paracoccus sp. PAR01]MBD9529401.1 cytochrome P450 [Paracoccus sp. PAR01]
MSLDIASLPSSDLDPFSIDFFDNPFPDHERLREAGPVVWLERYGIYAVARHAEVHQVLNDWGTFCSSRGVGLQDFSREKPWRQPSLVLETDPPEHDRARKVLARVLSPVTMRELRDGFAAAADAMVAGLIGRKLDGIADLAEAFPLSVFPDRIGLTQDGREHLLPYAGLAFNAFGPDNALRREAMARAAPHIAWVTEQCRRENLAPDSIGARIHAAADSGEVTADEATLLVRSLLTAGIDTTVNGIGAALYCLARFPDQFAALRADPKLARNAFEEAVRFESPVQTFFRTTTRETELSGVPLPEGAKVLMFLASANRDPRRWDRADAYDITRKTSGHVGFGSGVHMCVGQLVARLEGEVVLEALARHATAIEIAGTPVRSYNNTLRGLKALPLHIR